MPQNKRFYLSFGRHGAPAADTGIRREDMLKAFLIGTDLRHWLSPCCRVYHSPLARAATTAKFQALGLGCRNVTVAPDLDECASKFAVQQFVDRVITDKPVGASYFHFVTHLPIIEKLGLPALSTGEVCLLSADSVDDMRAYNYNTQIIAVPHEEQQLWHLSNLHAEELSALSADEIYRLLQTL